MKNKFFIILEFNLYFLLQYKKIKFFLKTIKKLIQRCKI